MNDYNFWKDFFDTYQSLSDLMKFAWLVVPPTFLISLVVLILRYRLAGKRVDHGVDGELVYSVYRGADQQLQVFRHDRQLPYDPELLLVDDRPSIEAPQRRPG